MHTHVITSASLRKNIEQVFIAFVVIVGVVIAQVVELWVRHGDPAAADEV